MTSNTLSRQRPKLPCMFWNHIVCRSSSTQCMNSSISTLTTRHSQPIKEPSRRHKNPSQVTKNFKKCIPTTKPQNHHLVEIYMLDHSHHMIEKYAMSYTHVYKQQILYMLTLLRTHHLFPIDAHVVYFMSTGKCV